MSKALSNFNWRAWFVFLTSLVLLFMLSSRAVYANEIAVNSNCTLANAITASNTDTASGGCPAGSGIDTISLSGSITLSAALPQLTKGVTINGNSHSIDGAGGYRIFDIATAYNGDGNAASQRIFTINNLTMRNGSSGEGGAIRVVGARADNLASLTLSNCNIYGSRSSSHAGGIFARNALLNVGPTTLLSGNSAAHSGGAIWADSSTVNITGGSTLTNNTAGLQGGSISTMVTTLTLQNAAVTHSSANADGGGIAYLRGSGRAMTLTFVVANDNRSSGDGGAVYANFSTSTANISSSTFFNNTSRVGANDWYFIGGGAVTLDGEDLSY